MKRTLLFLLIATLACSYSYAQNRYLSFRSVKKKTAIDAPTDVTENEIIPKLKVSSTQNSTTLSYTFTGGYIADVIGMDKNVYEYIHVKGFGKMSEVGKPALPAHSDMVATLGTKNPTIKIVDVEYIEYDNFNIHPTLAPPVDLEGGDNVEFVKDEKTYSTNEFFPKRIVKLKEALEYRGNYFSSVRVVPVQYNPVTKKIRVYSKITYIVSYDGGKAPKRNSDLELMEDVIINEDVLDTDNTESSYDSKDPNYLILARTDFAEAAETLAQWKSQLGYRTEIILGSSWTYEKVKEAVHTRYNSYSIPPSYLTIIGDHEQVPGKVRPSNYGLYSSDLDYVCTGGEDDYFPDMAKGRISGRTPEQALMIINKGINYEKNPISDESFYKNALNCAEFQDKVNPNNSSEKPDGYAARRFCHTSEEVRDYVKSQGYEVTRVYKTRKANNPTNFNNGWYSDGQKIPDELLRSNGFNWDGNATDIIREINEGKFYVLHRDHGYTQGWGSPGFNVSNVKKLTNGDKLPIVFSMNCQTGGFYDECFAEAFVRQENGGAVGVIGASQVSYSGYNDGLTVGMFDAIWSSPGIKPNFGSAQKNSPQLPGHQENIRSMGDVLNQGLIRMRETFNGSPQSYKYTHRLFHYFGDPALKMWVRNPQEITATYANAVSCGTTTFNVSDISVDNGVVTLVQGDLLIARTELSDNSASLTFQAVDDRLPLMLTISSDSHKPVVTEIQVKGCTNIPQPEFLVSSNKVVNTGAELKRVLLTNKTTYSPTSFEWEIVPSDFEYAEGTNANSENPIVEFKKAGTYTISLTATNSNGSRKVTKADCVEVIESTILEPSCRPITKLLDKDYGYGIRYIEIGRMNNASRSSVAEKATNGYMDFTDKVAILKKGKEETFKLRVGNRLQENATIFIDYNNDGEFDNESERVKDVTPFNYMEGSITVAQKPADAVVRLRVISDFKGNKITDACYSPQFGQVEDYSVAFENVEPDVEVVRTKDVSYNSASIDVAITFDGGEAVTKRGLVYTTDPSLELSKWTMLKSSSTEDGFTFDLTSLAENTTYYAKGYAANSIGESYSEKTFDFITYSHNRPTNHAEGLYERLVTSSIINLGWEDAEEGTLPHGYIIKWSIEGYDKIEPPVDGVAEQESESVAIVKYGVENVHLESLKENTKYYFKVFPYVNGSNEVLYKTDGLPEETEITTLPYGTYPTKAFETPDVLEFVRFNSFYNNWGRAKLGYVDYRDDYHTIVKPGETYELTVGTNPLGNEKYYLVAWIDWNKNGWFEENEEFDMGMVQGTRKVNVEITVPEDVDAGWTTMRVTYAKGVKPSFCDQTPSKSGSIEDYKLIIDPNAKPHGVWRGTVSSDWNEPENWEDKTVPDYGASILLVSGAAFYPETKSQISVYNVQINEGANLTNNKGSIFIVYGDLRIKNGGKLNLKNGSTSIAGNLYIGEGDGGEFLMENGSLHILGDIFTPKNSKVEILDGYVDIGNWKREPNNSWALGNIHFGGGDISVSDFQFSKFSTVVMDGPVVIRIKGTFHNYDGGWQISDGTFIFENNRKIGAWGSKDAAMAAYNLVIEESCEAVFCRNTASKKSGVKILGDLTVKGKAHFVNNGAANSFVSVEGKTIVEESGELITGDCIHSFKKDLIIKGKVLSENSSVFVLDGTEVQTLEAASSIPNLEVSNEKGVQLSNDFTIDQKLTLTKGSFRLNGQNLTLAEAAVIENASSSVFPNVIIAEKAEEIRKVMGETELKGFYLPIANSTEDLPVELDITNVTPSGKYFAFSMINKADDSVAGASLNRSWRISTEEGFGDFKVDAKLTYSDADVADIDESKLIPAFKNTIWKELGSIDTENNKLLMSTTEVGVVSALTRPVLTYNIDYANESTKEIVRKNVKYGVSADLASATMGDDEVISLKPNSKVYFKLLDNESSLGSEVFALEVPARPEASAYGIDYIAETTKEVVPSTVEYSSDNFITTTTGTGSSLKLIPSFDLKFRVKATENTFKSEAIELVVPARPNAPEFSIDYAAETTKEIVVSTVEYSKDGFTTATSGADNLLELTPESNLKFRVKATENAFRSEATELTVPARPAAPTFSIDYVAETTKEAVPSTVEYSKDGFVTTTLGTDNLLELTPESNLKFRVKATELAFRSEVTELVMPARPVAPTFSIDYAAETTKEIVSSTIEYSSNDFANAFTGSEKTLALQPESIVKFRLKATATAFTSETTELTIPARPVAPTFSIDYVAEATKEAVPTTVEYSSDNFATVEAGTEETLALQPESSLKFRVKATETEFKSEATELKVPARPEAPTIPVVDKYNDTFDFTCVPEFLEASAYEVSFNNGEQWAAVTTKPVTLGSSGRILVRVAASNEEGKECFSGNTLESDIVLAAEDFNFNPAKRQISLYPNPSSGKFFIDLHKLPVSDLKVVVFNSKGQLISNYKENNMSNPEIDLTGQGKGIYYIKMISNEFNVTKKVVVE